MDRPHERTEDKTMADNIRAKAQDNNLFLKIDLGENFGPTKSGKTEIVAQAFWMKLDEALNRADLEGYKLNIMLVKPKGKAKQEQVDSFDDDTGFDEEPAKPARKAPTRKAPAKKPAAKPTAKEETAKPTRRRAKA